MKSLFVLWLGARFHAWVRLTESLVRLTEAFGSSRCDHLQRQQTLGKGKRHDWQVLRKTEMLGGRAPIQACRVYGVRGRSQRGKHWDFHCIY